MGIEELVGKTMAKVYKQDAYRDELVFETVDGRTFKFYHNRIVARMLSLMTS